MFISSTQWRFMSVEKASLSLQTLWRPPLWWKLPRRQSLWKWSQWRQPLWRLLWKRGCYGGSHYEATVIGGGGAGGGGGKKKTITVTKVSTFSFSFCSACCPSSLSARKIKKGIILYYPSRDL